MDENGQAPHQSGNDTYDGPVITRISPDRHEVWVANGTRSVEEVFAPPGPLERKVPPPVWASLPTDQGTVERTVESFRAETWDLEDQDPDVDEEVDDEGVDPLPEPLSSVSTACDDAVATEVRVLGPIEVVGWRQTPERAIVTELACYLALHGDRPISGDELRTALWPDDVREASAKSLRTYMSLLRRALGSDRVPQGTSAGYRLAADVLVDWVRFKELTRPESSQQELSTALELIRGRPFAGAPSQAFGWIYSELLVSEMEVAVVRAANRLAGAQGQGGGPGISAWAIDQAILAVPSDIGLWEHKLAIAHSRGPDDFRRASRDAEAVLGEDAQPLIQAAG
jgi:hypothetical protein